MTNIVTFKWKRSPAGYQLPNCCDYTVEHVNNVHSMCRRHGNFDQFILITDDIHGEYDAGIDVYPIWEAEDLERAGGCFRRLPVYGRPWPKFLMIDLDCVVTGSIQHLLDRPEPLVLNRYCLPGTPKQHYNGALQLVDTESPEVRGIWEDFDLSIVPAIGKKQGFVGTDQAWLSYYFGPGLPTFGPEHGVRDIRDCGVRLPDNTCIVFFHGARDPSMCDYPWVREHWR